jgi:alkylation response protein AidB-like acyl-CoA dehydrogenase
MGVLQRVGFHGPGEAGHMFLVPRSDVSTIDDWFPTGMRGTGSRSLAVEDVFVPDHRVQPVSDVVNNIKERRALHPTFDTLYAPWPSHGRFTFAAVAVGAAYGAAKHFLESAASATRMASSIGGRVRLVDSDYVATELADIFGELESAIVLIGQRSSEASERARRHEPSHEPDLAREDRDNALVARIALRSVQRLALVVGSKAGFPEHPVSRAIRDVEVISHHVSLNWRQVSVRFLKSQVG